MVRLAVWPLLCSPVSTSYRLCLAASTLCLAASTVSRDLPAAVVYTRGMVRRKNPYAVQLGRKGAKARAAKLTPEQRREIARKAAHARWAKRKPLSEER